jgi:hypothetical protein
VVPAALPVAAGLVLAVILAPEVSALRPGNTLAYTLVRIGHAAGGLHYPLVLS